MQSAYSITPADWAKGNFKNHLSGNILGRSGKIMIRLETFYLKFPLIFVLYIIIIIYDIPTSNDHICKIKYDELPIHFGFLLKKVLFSSFNCFDSVFHLISNGILNKSGNKHSIKRQLYGHLPPITQTIQVKGRKYAGHCWRSKEKLIYDILLRTPSTHGQINVGQPAKTYITNSVGTLNIILRTYEELWSVGTDGVNIYVCVCV